MELPIGITLGDPGGIGIEITLKALQKIKGKFIIIGNLYALKYYSQSMHLSIPENVQIIPVNGNFLKKKVSRENGKIALRSLNIAKGLLLNKYIKSVVTAPVSKKALHIAGFNFPGQTEFFADIFHTKMYGMMMVSKKIKIIFVTGHIPLSSVSDTITREMIIEKTEIGIKTLMKLFNIKNPQVGILSLNPHNGEEGDMGKEEIEIIIPAIQYLRKKKYRVNGPFAPDTYWANKRDDLTVAIYHDEGMIPFKILAFNKGVNFTTGLPFIRTSPDHGTAFDIVGKGIANPKSMIASIKLAKKLEKKL